MEEEKKSLENREWICLHRSIIELGLNDFPDTDSAINFFQAVSQYSLHGKLPDDFPMNACVKPVWRYVKEMLDYGIKKYLNSPGPPKGSRNNPNGRKGKNLQETNSQLTETNNINYEQ